MKTKNLQLSSHGVRVRAVGVRLSSSWIQKGQSSAVFASIALSYFSPCAVLLFWFPPRAKGHLLELYYSCSSAYGQTHNGCCLFYWSCLGSETLAKARRTSSQYTMRQGRRLNKKKTKVNLCSSSKKFTIIYLLPFFNSHCPIFLTEK